MTSFSGIHKRDDYSKPVTSVNDWKLRFLNDSAELLQTWKESHAPGLSAETFTAWIISLKSIAEMAQYLIQQHNCTLILLQKKS